jgi:hypothetical protein
MYFGSMPRFAVAAIARRAVQGSAMAALAAAPYLKKCRLVIIDIAASYLVMANVLTSKTFSARN